MTKLHLVFAFLCISFLGCGQDAAFLPAAPPAAPLPPAPATPAPPPAPAANSGEPMPPAHAKVFEHLEDNEPWEHCTHCAAHPHKDNPPLAVWEFDQHQQTPSRDGSSTRFFVGGSQPYGNALHWTKVGNQNKYSNFIWQFYVYASPESLKAQALESDLFQGHNGRKYMFGSQCNYDKGVWQGWDETKIKWIDFPSAPCKKFEPGKWTRVKWHLERTDDNRLHYVSITVGDKTYKVDSYQPSAPSSWADSLGVQFQQDLDLNATDYAIWIDQVTLWIW